MKIQMFSYLEKEISQCSYMTEYSSHMIDKDRIILISKNTDNLYLAPIKSLTPKQIKNIHDIILKGLEKGKLHIQVNYKAENTLRFTAVTFSVLCLEWREFDSSRVFIDLEESSG